MLMTYMIYYHPTKNLCTYYAFFSAQKDHLEKYGSVVLNSIKIKQQNILFADFPYNGDCATFCKHLTAIYNPNKNNITSYTPENYPELYI